LTESETTLLRVKIVEARLTSQELQQSKSLGSLVSIACHDSQDSMLDEATQIVE
jgi:hypothetical protein